MSHSSVLSTLDEQGSCPLSTHTLALSLTCLVEPGDPLHESFACHPGFLVGVLPCREGLDVVETPRLCRPAQD